jgi:hypothetical protein
VISRDRPLPSFCPYEEEPFPQTLTGIPNFSAATGCSRRGLHDGPIGRELTRHRFTQPRPPHLGVHARALGIRGGLADWDLLVFVNSDSGATEALAHRLTSYQRGVISGAARLPPHYLDVVQST